MCHGSQSPPGNVLYLKCSGEAKGWIPSESASLDLKLPAKLVLLLGLDSKCLFIATLLELGLVGLEITSSLEMTSYKNKCAVVNCGLQPWVMENLSTQEFICGE